MLLLHYYPQNGAGEGASQANDYNSSTLNGAGDFSAITSPNQRKIAQAIQLLVTPDSEGVTAQQVASKLSGMTVDQITLVCASSWPNWTPLLIFLPCALPLTDKR